MSPDQLSFGGFEKGFPSRIVIAIAFDIHRYLEHMLSQDFLIVMRTILAAPIRVVEATFRWATQGNSHVQCPDSKVAFHSVAGSSR